MNGKFLVLLLISFNIMTILFTYGLVVEGNGINNNDNFFLGFFLITANFEGDNIKNIAKQGSVDLTDGSTDALESLSKQDSAGAGILGTAFSFIDVMKMVISTISLLTPMPVLAFFYTLDLPIFFILLIAFPLFVMYLLAIASFVKGTQF